MKNADFRGGAICRTRKGATACVEVPSSVPGPSGTRFFLFRTHFLGFSWGFHGVFRGFDGLRRLWRESPEASSPHFLPPPRRVFFPRPWDVGRAHTPCFCAEDLARHHRLG